MKKRKYKIGTKVISFIDSGGRIQNINGTIQESHYCAQCNQIEYRIKTIYEVSWENCGEKGIKLADIKPMKLSEFLED